MNTITRTLLNKQHSLIESPTGTGKTLVLLCTALAWQSKSKELGQPFISDALRKENAEKRLEKLRKRPCTCGRRSTINELEELKENIKKETKGSCKEGLETVQKVEATDWDEEEDEDGDSLCKRVKLDENPNSTTTVTTSPYFKKPKKESTPDFIIIDEDDNDDCQIISAENEKPVKQQQHKSDNNKLKEDTSNNSNKKIKDDLCISCAALEAEKTFKIIDENIGDEENGDELDDNAEFSTKFKGRIPKIYYGTRTHKQITQVIRELNKTPYKDALKMCILSSRDRTCVNDDVKDLSNRNDRCQELIKNSGSKSKSHESCPYYLSAESNARVFETINNEYESKAWDIEDAYKFGKAHIACPYYGSRSLQEQADITFSPYNYLLDPSIRQAMDINLSQSIIIFDEAHNIEDICRESASFVIDTKQIDDLIEAINTSSNLYLQGSDIRNAYQFFKDKLLCLKGSLQRFVFEESSNPYGDREQRKKLTQIEMDHYLRDIGLGPDSLSKLKENLNLLKGGDDEENKSHDKGDDQQAALSFNQLQHIIQLCITLGFMYANNSKHKDDFRAVATRQLESDYVRFNSRASSRQTQQALTSNSYVWQLSILCMNPGIAFEKITSLAWSIIVASGTLSPIESLKTELGCTFSNIFEGKHVIDSERIFASILSSGPNRVDLNCAFTNSLKLEFQDEVGFIVRDVCKVVPNGILCFFPSYERMDNFYQRWFAKGLIMEMEKSGKKLFREKKNSNVNEFEMELENYNRHAKKKGALLFAVFRGKVSEGIDFADNAARAVLTIGIPYPNVKEVTVDLKRNYNDVARAERSNLMPGRDWYAAQAFRALNQALGRCIRHKADWGAIIMIDSRLKSGNTLNNISKWLRSVMRDSNNYSNVKGSLEEFVQTRVSEIDNI